MSRSRYNDDLDYLITDVDVFKAELEEIISEADKIIYEFDSSKQETLKAYFKKVQCLQKLEKYEESKGFIDKLLKFNSNMPETLARLENVPCENKCFEKEELEKIITDADRIIYKFDCDKQEIVKAYLKKVQCLQKLEKYEESKEFILKLLKINPDMPEALARLGNLHCENKHHKKAIDRLTKAITIKPDYAYAHNRLGNVKYKLSDYRGAIADYNEAIKFKADYVAAYNNRGCAKSELFDYRGAIDDYTKAIDLKPDPKPKSNPIYGGRGDAKYDSSDWDGAIADYTEAIDAQPNRPEGYIARGNANFNLKTYDKAIKDYTSAIELFKAFKHCAVKSFCADTDKQKELLDNDSPRVIKLICETLGSSKDKREVIDYFRSMVKRRLSMPKLDDYLVAQSFEDFIKNPSLYETAYNNRGKAYCEQENYSSAIKDYNKAIEINPNYVKAYANRGYAHAKLGNNSKAIKDFKESKTDVLELLDLDKDIVSGMLDEDEFFKDALEAGDSEKKKEYEAKKDAYKKIYIDSLEIIRGLLIKEEIKKEMPVSHYTKVSTVENLLFDDLTYSPLKALDTANDLKIKLPESPYTIIIDSTAKKDDSKAFRLSSLDTSNDPQEGETLFHYLFPEENMSLQVEKFGAFAGCFIMNNDSLNQFRLYGKKDKQEGTGASIAVGKEFFHDSIRMPIMLSAELTSKEEENPPNLLPLFRCVYIDPESGHKKEDKEDFVSLGQKEEYVFYKDGKGKEYEGYKSYIEDVHGKTKEGLSGLKTQIQEGKLAPEVVYKLLLRLRYLVKHVAFKEEQECRIVRICSLEHKDVKMKNRRLYVDYLKLKPEYVKKICFAPRATNIDNFRLHLARNGYSGVECYQSKMPLAHDDDAGKVE